MSSLQVAEVNGVALLYCFLRQAPWCHKLCLLPEYPHMSRFVGSQRGIPVGSPCLFEMIVCVIVEARWRKDLVRGDQVCIWNHIFIIMRCHVLQIR